MALEEDGFAGDLLIGAEEIAYFLFGDRQQRRKVYYLDKIRLPTFRMASKICARRSVLRKWVEDQEDRNTGKMPRPEAHQSKAKSDYEKPKPEASVSK